jgi:hypothetical protein
MALCGFQLGGFNLGAGSALPNRARLLLNKVPGASALYMPDRKLSSRIINGVRVLKDAGDPKPEADFSPAQIANSELLTFLDGADGKTPILYDWSGNGNHATQTTVANQPFIATAGVLEEGLRFAGGQWLDTGSETIGDGLFAGSDRRWTVSVWAKLNQTGDGIVLARAGSTATSQSFSITTATNSTLVGVRLRGNPNTITLTGNVWRLITVTWDGATANRYLNDGSPTALSVGASAEETGQRIIVGARTNGTAIFLNQSNIAFVGIWNRALTAAEIETVYNLTDPR